MTCPWLIYQHFSFVWWSCKQQCTVPYYTSCTQLTNLQLSRPHCLCRTSAAVCSGGWKWPVTAVV